MKSFSIGLFLFLNVSILFADQVCQFYGTRAVITVPDGYQFSGLPSVSLSDDASGIMITYQMSDESAVEALKSNKFLFMWRTKAGNNKVYYKTFSEEDFRVYLMVVGDEEESVLITGFIEGKENFRRSHKKMLSILSTVQIDSTINKNYDSVYFFSEFNLDGLIPVKIENRNIYFTSYGSPIETADIIYKLAIEKNYRYKLDDLKHEGNPTDHLIEFGKSISTKWIDLSFKEYDGYSFMTLGDDHRYELVSFCIVDGYIYTVGGVYRNTDESSALKDYTERIKTFKVKDLAELTKQMTGLPLSQ